MDRANASPIVLNFLDKLDGVRASGEQWVARCPCRDDDESPSLSIAEGAEGRVLVNCHRGGNSCDTKQICAAMGITIHDLYPPRVKSEEQKKVFVDGELKNVYSYVDEHGELVFQVLRFLMSDGKKQFRQRVPDPEGDGWKYSTQHLTERPLYRLPEVLRAKGAGRVIYVAEGEKDVDALWEAGFAATCNPMGADTGTGNKWRPNHTASLAGARVVVIADNDEPGLIHAHYVAKELSRAGCMVKVKRCPEGSKDAYDLLHNGMQIVDLIEVALYEPDAFWETAQKITELANSESLSQQNKVTKALEIIRVGLEVPNPDNKPLGRLVTWRDFIQEVADDRYDWLIENMLERQERMMVVAAEGVGKTTLARQVAILAGAGIHPFTYHEITPVKTLFVDLENPEKIIRRQSRRIIEAIRMNYPKRDIQASLFTKPDGLNILTQQGKDILESQIQATEPDLIVLGPIYKSFIDPGGKTSTALITEVAMYFDYLRSVYGVALWLEHHAPLGNALTGRDLRPSDSAVWMRWPEFGFAIAPDPTSFEREYEFKQWRGPRDSRSWPARMKRGSLFPFEVTEWAAT